MQIYKIISLNEIKKKMQIKADFKPEIYAGSA